MSYCVVITFYLCNFLASLKLKQSMTLFRFRWLRRLIRNNTTPIPMDKAAVWKERLAVAYMLVSLNFIGTCVYYYYHGKPDLAEYYGLKTDEEVNKKPAIYFAELLGVKNAHVLRYKGLQKVEEFDYTKENDGEELNVNKG